MALGNKNITKLFAGGCHSWVVLDSIVPTREDYRHPSPVGRSVEEMSSANTPLKKRTNNSAMRNQTLGSHSGNKLNLGRNASLSPF